MSYTVLSVAGDETYLIGQEVAGHQQALVELGPDAEIEDIDNPQMLMMQKESENGLIVRFELVDQDLDFDDYFDEKEAQGWVVIGFDTISYFATIEEFEEETGHSAG